jgi:hypothetical protein
MTSTSFEFTMSMPGDERLIPAVRDLAAHACAYAGLAEAASASLTSQVTATTSAAMAAARGRNGDVQFRFTRENDTLTVAVGLDSPGQASWPPTVEGAEGLTVRTEREGGRETCLVIQRVA